MKIETKYNIGDTVWTLDTDHYGGWPYQTKVTEIHIRVYGSGFGDIHYLLGTSAKVNESGVYSTEEQLYKSCKESLDMRFKKHNQGTKVKRSVASKAKSRNKKLTTKK